MSKGKPRPERVLCFKGEGFVTVPLYDTLLAKINEPAPRFTLEERRILKLAVRRLRSRPDKAATTRQRLRVAQAFVILQNHLPQKTPDTLIHRRVAKLFRCDVSSVRSDVDYANKAFGSRRGFMRWAMTDLPLPIGD